MHAGTYANLGGSLLQEIITTKVTRGLKKLKLTTMTRGY